MPLTTLVGLPHAGKSRVANALFARLAAADPVSSSERFRTAPIKASLRASKAKRVVLIDDAALGIARPALAHSRQEKEARANVKASVERALDAHTIVILDAPNFVKGFRYELYCRVRERHTTHCVVFCDTPVDTCRQRNVALQEEKKAEAYPDAILEDLLRRMERPDPAKRWDVPLFVVRPEDTVPYDDIITALLHGQSQAPSAATSVRVAPAGNVLHQLDAVTQDIVAVFLKAKQPGVPIRVPYCDEPILLARPLPLPALKRAQRDFLRAIRVGGTPPPPTREAAAAAFVRHILVGMEL